MSQRRSGRSHKKSKSEREKAREERRRAEEEAEEERRRAEEALPHCMACGTTEDLMVACGCVAEDMRYFCYPCLEQHIRANYDYPCHWCPNRPIHYGNNTPRITRRMCRPRLSAFRRYMWRIILRDMFYMYLFVVVIVILLISLLFGLYLSARGLSGVRNTLRLWRIDATEAITYGVFIAVVAFSHLCLLISNILHHYLLYTEWFRARQHPWWSVTFRRYAPNGRLQVTSSYDVCADRWAANKNQHDPHFREEDRDWANDVQLINPNV